MNAVTLAPLAALALTISAPVALAQISLFGPIDRRVFVSAFIHHPLHSNYGGQDAYENHTVGPWLGSGSQGPSVGDETGYGSIAATIGQQGNIETGYLTATLGTNVDISSAGTGSGDVVTNSYYEVAFAIFSPQVIDVDLDFEGSGGSRGATLLRSNGVPVFGTAADLDTTYTIYPDTYTLTAQVSTNLACSNSCAHLANPSLDMTIYFAPVPPPACPADMGEQGGNPGSDGLLDNNDFVVFIGYFFTPDWRADLGRQGGLPGPDGLLDNNDFVVFIQEFFGGC